MKTRKIYCNLNNLSHNVALTANCSGKSATLEQECSNCGVIIKICNTKTEQYSNKQVLMLPSVWFEFSGGIFAAYILKIRNYDSC